MCKASLGSSGHVLPPAETDSVEPADLTRIRSRLVCSLLLQAPATSSLIWLQKTRAGKKATPTGLWQAHAASWLPCCAHPGHAALCGLQPLASTMKSTKSRRRQVKNQVQSLCSQTAKPSSCQERGQEQKEILRRICYCGSTEGEMPSNSGH